MAWQKSYGEQLTLRNEAYYSFAERLITLSTGALALSIAFRQSFSQPIPVHVWLLKTSWIAFTVTIIMALLVQFGRVTLHSSLAHAIREAGDLPTLVAGHPGWWFRYAGFGMLISFPVAITSLAAFALYNLR
jgi:hypothetical protein